MAAPVKAAEGVGPATRRVRVHHVVTGRGGGGTVGPPLAMDAEAMRRTGYAAVDALVARLADPAADPVLRRASPAEMRARLGGPPPEQGAGLDAVLARVLEDVLPYAARTDHPGYFAFIPCFTTWPAALAELTATAANPFSLGVDGVGRRHPDRAGG